MNCQRVIRALSAFQDRELDPALGQEVARHVQDCAACRAELAGLQELVLRLRRLPTPAVDPFFPARVMAGLRSRPSRKHGLLRAAAYATIFIMIFLSGFFLQRPFNGQAASGQLPENTLSSVLLEPQGLGLLAVHEDTLSLFEGSDDGQK